MAIFGDHTWMWDEAGNIKILVKSLDHFMIDFLGSKWRIRVHHPGEAANTYIVLKSFDTKEEAVSYVDQVLT